MRRCYQFASFVIVYVLEVSPYSTNEFDYIVVGAGTAGSTAAAFLARQPHTTVALLDAGVWKRRHQWDFMQTESHQGPDFYNYQQACAGSKCKLLGGKVLGGSSAIHGAAYTRPARSDLPWVTKERFENAYSTLELELPKVLVSMTWDEISKSQLFRELVRSLESFAPGKLKWRFDPHEHGAPIARISGYYRSQTPLMTRDGNIKTYFESLSEANYLARSRVSQRVTPYDFLIRRRAHERGRTPHVFPNTTVRQVLIRSGIVVGVFTNSGQAYFARKEVVLCAGALETPTILHASGLSSNKDHVDVGVFPFQDHRAVWVKCDIEGIADVSPSGLVFLAAFLNSSSANTKSVSHAPEFELFITPRQCLKKGWSCVDIGVILLHPTSEGRLVVRTSGSFSDVAVKSIETELSKLDVERFRKMMKLLGSVIGDVSNALGPLGKTSRMAEFDPLILASAEESVSSDDRFAAALRGRLTTWNHPSGTCPVGRSVDEHFRFFGVQALRVADASILPLSASGHTDAAARMVGFLVADEIARERMLVIT